MAYFTAAGTTLSVATGAPATFDAAGFEANTYSLVGEVTSVPSHGAEYALVTHNPIADRVTRKLKGSVNYGSITIPMALDVSDEGQDIMRDHADGAEVDTVVSCEVAYPDGTTEYFTALVMSFTTAGDGVDSILSAEAMLEIDSQVITVEPVPAP